MNIQILDSWLREYLDTLATPRQIAKILSLCGPSVEKVEKHGNDWLYNIEVTTNRVDAMSVYGIARETAAILPQFGIKASLKRVRYNKPTVPKKLLPLFVKSDKNLVYRTIGVVVEDIKNWQSPSWMATRLNASGIRPLNSIVDITNYVMTEFGHPMHAFDYDKIPDSTIIIRESKKGEKIVSLEDRQYSLPGGDIVFQSAKGEIIDLPGIIGTKNSIVSNETKRVLFFVDNNDPNRIRKSSMSLAIRTVAATLNEKGVDPELGMVVILRAIDLSKKIAKARLASKIYDNYVSFVKPKTIETTSFFIEKRLGVEIEKTEIASILNSLEFGASWSGDKLDVIVPSHRVKDVEIQEDIVEEIARIYGYHNLPSNLMEGKIPDPYPDPPFEFEMKIKQALKGLGGIEIYTLSLVSRTDTVISSLRLTNPLGGDSEYLRTSLMPSLLKVVDQNSGETAKPYHLFEMANVYLPRKDSLPEERMTLAGIFVGSTYREAKGIVEALLEELNVKWNLEIQDAKDFLPARRVVFLDAKTEIGELEIVEKNNLIYYQFEVEKLRKTALKIKKYTPIPKYPPQIEDLTLTVPEKTKIGDLLSFIKSQDPQIVKVELEDVYNNSHTFRIWYQNPGKTLTNEEVESVRDKLLKEVKSKFGAYLKT